MKIFLINWQDRRNPLSGGAEIHLHEIFGRIAEKGNETTLLCCSFPDAKKTEFVDGINVVRVGRRSTFNFYVTSACKSLLAKTDYDIVIDNINKIPFFTPLYIPLPLLVIGYHFFGTAIYRETNPAFASYVYFAEKLIPKVYKNELFSVLSKSTKDELVNWGIPEKKIYIISPAVNPEFAPQFRSKSKTPLIAYLGRIKKYKCVDILLYAMHKIVTRIPSARLIIIGTGDYLRPLAALTKRLKLEDYVEFKGFVPEREKKGILQSAWVVVNTSLKEGWGITNIEANACGTPVIASNSPGLRDSISDGRTGFLLEHGDLNALVHRLLQIIEDRSLREGLAKNAVLWAKQFTWNRAADDMYELMKFRLGMG